MMGFEGRDESPGVGEHERSIRRRMGGRVGHQGRKAGEAEDGGPTSCEPIDAPGVAWDLSDDSARENSLEPRVAPAPLDTMNLQQAPGSK